MRCVKSCERYCRRADLFSSRKASSFGYENTTSSWSGVCVCACVHVCVCVCVCVCACVRVFCFLPSSHAYILYHSRHFRIFTCTQGKIIIVHLLPTLSHKVGLVRKKIFKFSFYCYRKYYKIRLGIHLQEISHTLVAQLNQSLSLSVCV